MNLNVVDSVCIPSDGKATNEDDLFFNEKAAFVADGATGLGEPLIKGEGSDAAWFVQAFKAAFDQALTDSETIDKALHRAVNDVSREFDRLLAGVDVAKHQMPSSGLVLASVHNGTLTLNRMGDCEIHCLLRNGTVWTFPPSPLEAMDQKSIELFSKELMAGKSYAEARVAVNPTLIKHRSTMNTPEGYSALSPDLGCLQFIEAKQMHAADVSKILLCSDGFSSAFSNYNLCQARDILRSSDCSLTAFAEKLRDLERSDADLSRYPRLKPQDDCTALMIEMV